MRSRRGLAFRPSLAVSVRLECLEDRRLLSALGGSSGAEDLPTGNSSQLVGDSAVVMSVNASQANASGTDSPGDSSVSVVNVVYTAANDGESSGAQAQGTASSSDFAGPTSAPSASTVSDLGETTASPSAELAQTTPTAASAPLASKGTTSGLGVTTPSPSAPLPQTTSTAVVNRGSGIGSSSAAEQTPGDEATTNLSSGTSSSSQAELTPADEGVSAAEQTPGDEATTNLSSGTSSSSQAKLTPADEGVSAASAYGSVPDALISSGSLGWSGGCSERRRLDRGGSRLRRARCRTQHCGRACHCSSGVRQPIGARASDRGLVLVTRKGCCLPCHDRRESCPDW